MYCQREACVRRWPPVRDVARRDFACCTHTPCVLTPHAHVCVAAQDKLRPELASVLAEPGMLAKLCAMQHVCGRAYPPPLPPLPHPLLPFPSHLDDGGAVPCHRLTLVPVCATAHSMLATRRPWNPLARLSPCLLALSLSARALVCMAAFTRMHAGCGQTRMSTLLDLVPAMEALFSDPDLAQPIARELLTAPCGPAVACTCGCRTAVSVPLPRPRGWALAGPRFQCASLLLFVCCGVLR
jgi:hypothetical protein